MDTKYKMIKLSDGYNAVAQGSSSMVKLEMEKFEVVVAVFCLIWRV